MKERPPPATRLCAKHRASAKQKCGERNTQSGRGKAKQFCGRKGFALPRLNSDLAGFGFPPRRRVREECAADSFLDFLAASNKTRKVLK